MFHPHGFRLSLIAVKLIILEVQIYCYTGNYTRDTGLLPQGCVILEVHIYWHKANCVTGTDILPQS